MKIVIEIDNEHYERIMRLEEGVTVYPTTLALYEAVKNGIPLPKGHGRLKDVDWIDDNCEYHHSDKDGSWCYALRDIDNAPTIIEADKEG